MPIAPWNPGGYYPFTYGQSTNPIMPASNNAASLWANPSAGGAGSGSNVTGQAVANNLSAAPDIASLTQLINNLNISAQQQANAARIPNATGLETQSSANIGNELAGLMDPADKTLLAQAAAERGVAIGSPGSPNVDSNFLANYFGGIENLKQLGQQNLTAADARNPVAKLFDPTTQLITPAQQGSLNNQANQLALDWYSVLHPQSRGTGGGGYGPMAQPAAPDTSWFSRALASAGGLNQPAGVSPIGVPPTQSIYNPNTLQPTSDTGFWFGDPYSGDTSSLLDAPSGYDPFAAYG